jgi:hypothetical protein
MAASSEGLTRSVRSKLGDGLSPRMPPAPVVAQAQVKSQSLLPFSFCCGNNKNDDVIPAKAGIQVEKLDSRLRENDKTCIRNIN